jgi:hypothetical protein
VKSVSVSESISQTGPSHSPFKLIQFELSGTSKFPRARVVVDRSGQQVTIRKTLAYGSKYGIGVFSLFETGEQQIGWVPERKKGVWEYVGAACQHTSIQAKVHEVSCKQMGNKFCKVKITIMYES